MAVAEQPLRAGLRDLGYVEGRNLLIDARWGEGSRECLDQLAAELIQSKPHVIVTQGGPATYPFVRVGAAVPVVFGFSGDPVEGKLVESFARPGRNLTGVSFLSLELVGKRIELLIGCLNSWTETERPGALLRPMAHEITCSKKLRSTPALPGVSGPAPAPRRRTGDVRGVVAVSAPRRRVVAHRDDGPPGSDPIATRGPVQCTPERETRHDH